MADVRVKDYGLRAGDVRQIKILEIDKPIRFVLESGSFTYDVLVGSSVVSTGTAVASGVVIAPGGCWGSEIRITCTGDGVLKVAHMG